MLAGNNRMKEITNRARTAVLGHSERRAEGLRTDLVASIKRGPQHRLPNAIILMRGTPKEATPEFGKPPICSYGDSATSFLGFRVTRHMAVCVGAEAPRRCMNTDCLHRYELPFVICKAACR